MTTPTEPRARLDALAVHLKAHGVLVDPTEEGLIVRNPEAPGCCANRPMPADTITCRPYKGDGDRLWFFTSWQQPIAEADRITDTVVAVKGYLTPRT